MMPHQPAHALIVVLLTCEACRGDTVVTDAAGRLNACHQCVNGYQSVALPAEKVLACYTPTPEYTYQLLRALALEAPAVRHPLVYNVVDVPYRLHRPLLNNPSDLPRKSPDTPTFVQPDPQP